MATKKTAQPEFVNNGNWSNAAPEVPMFYKNIELKFLMPALGTQPASKDIFKDYIASNAPDAPTMEQEIEQFGEEEVARQGITIYPKGQFYYDEEHDRFVDIFDKNISYVVKTQEDEEIIKYHHINNPEINGVATKTDAKVPFYYNYQIRGMFKDSCGLLTRAEKDDTQSGKLKAFKKVIDGGIFVYPRRIGINLPESYLDEDGVTEISTYDENGNLRVCSRSLRTSGPTGERVAIASSEMIPAGSTIKFTIGVCSEKFWPAVFEWLNYLSVHGLSGWRNSGLGTCVWRELDENFMPVQPKSEDAE